MSAAGTWDFVYGITNRGLNGLLGQIAAASPGLFGTTVAINGAQVEAVIVQIPTAHIASLQPVAGNSASAAVTLGSPGTQVLVIPSTTGFAPGDVSVTCGVQLNGSTLAWQVTADSISSTALTAYPGLADQVSGGLAFHIYDTLLQPFQLTLGAPMVDNLGAFSLTSIAIDGSHAAILAFSALTSSTLVLPDPDASWLTGGAFVGFGPNLLNTIIAPFLVPATQNSGSPDPNLSWDYSVPLIPDAGTGLLATIGRSDLPPSTVLIAFDLNTITPVTLHTPEPFPNFIYGVELSGIAYAQMRIDFEPMPSPGTWQPVGTITILDSTQVFVNPTQYIYDIGVDSWSLDFGDLMTEGLIIAIGNALIGLRFPLMMFETIAVTPPQGPALALNFINPTASALAAPGNSAMLVVKGDIGVTAAS
ncbi:hypothetical protein [Sphingomonas sp. G-3-2-10]|uniref:hypothetical protein n=1 Tax=Sphingomonas sp. G-3-2-10 TaxID=2728838 RepID=UPI00146F6FB6|nr:hypothetical protein [Sphingomonas sp. G-3-2-10]NML04418.1 hypothetical protein [Sphingomonas sp. G-3-2-10]